MGMEIKTLVAAMILLVSGPQLSTAQVAGRENTRSTRDGVYTEEQARRGEEVANDLCFACHVEDWFAESLLPSWDGSPLSFLYDLISTTMPEDQPGGLSPQQYADVLAYIFELNGLPAGKAELDAKKEALGQITIERRR